MKRKNATLSALFTSIISLLLCVSMLVGTTFAWFTDTVTSSGNKIQAGTLKIELYEKVGDAWDKISDSNRALFDYDKWEPGYTQATVLKVVNEGTLALKWYASVTPISADAVSDLADVIDVYTLEGATAAPASFAEVQSTYTRAGTLRDFLRGLTVNITGSLTAGQEATLGIALHMQEDAGNDYQGRALGTEFDIRIYATQLNKENDSFGNPDYDINSPYPGFSGAGNLTQDDAGNYQEQILTTAGNNPSQVTLPATMVQEFVENGTTQPELVAKDYQLEENDNGEITISYSEVGIVDQNGNPVDLSNNTTPIPAKLYVGETYAGKYASVYHDGVIVASAQVDAEGYVNYSVLHFCPVTIYVTDEKVDIVPDVENKENTDLVTKLVGSNVYTMSAGMAQSWYEYKNVPGKIEANIYLPQDLLAFSLMYTNGDLAETGSHSDLDIMADLDFTGINWAPIGRFYTNIHGNGHTISNLNDSLLGCVYDCQIDNLTLKNVTASGSASGVIAKELAGDIYLSNVTIAGENTVTYKADSNTNWPEGGTGVGAICGVSLIGCSGQGKVDVNVTGTIKVNYNDIFMGNSTNLENLGVSKEFGLNVYKENANVTVTGSKNITTTGTWHLLDEVSEGLYKDRNSRYPSFYVTSPTGLAGFAAWRNSNTVGEGSPIGAYCTLTCDLDMTGVEYTAFNGQFTHFNGNGYTISNLNAKQGLSGKGGLVSYLGGGIIENVTLENATVRGCQVGLFAGQTEGGTIRNCMVKGTENRVIWEQNTTSDYVETWGGYGALIGYCSGATMGTKDVAFAPSTVVTLVNSGMTTSGTHNNQYTGYGATPNGFDIATDMGTVIYEGVDYSVEESKLKISGEGAITVRGMVEYNTTIEEAVVEEGVAIIGNRTFRKCSNLKSVSLPSTLTHIADYAFSQSGITEIVIPENVTQATTGAVAYCSNLETIKIMGDNVHIGHYFARACASLKTVYIYGENVTFAASSMMFSNAENGNASNITIYVANETVKANLLASMGSVYGYTIVVGIPAN